MRRFVLFLFLFLFYFYLFLGPSTRSEGGWVPMVFFSRLEGWEATFFSLILGGEGKLKEGAGSREERWGVMDFFFEQ